MSQNPFNAISIIAEKRIADAIEAGEFDNLPGAGKPLALEDDSHIAPELRMACHVLKNAGYSPPELAERKEIDNILDLLEKSGDEREKTRQMQKLDFMLLRAGMRRNRHITLEQSDPYYEKVLNRLAIIKQDMRKK